MAVDQRLASWNDGPAAAAIRGFVRPVAEAIYGIPAERVIGSTNALRHEPDEHGGSIVYLSEPD